mgnify:CR=1 FL=1
MNFLANSAGMAIGRAAFAIMSAHVSPENIAAFARGSGSNRTLKHESHERKSRCLRETAPWRRSKNIVPRSTRSTSRSSPCSTSAPVIRWSSAVSSPEPSGLYDAKREEEIFAKVSSYNEGPLYNENLCEIYATILKIMKETPSV